MGECALSENPPASPIYWNTGPRDPQQVWFSGVAMAWVNITVQILVPSSRWSSSIIVETGTAAFFAVILQVLHHVVPELGSLQGYLEWHLSNIFYQASVDRGFSTFDIVVAASAALAASTAVQRAAERAYGDDTMAIKTVVNISALVIVNTVARGIMGYVQNNSAVDGLTVIVVTIVLVRAWFEIYSRLFAHGQDGAGSGDGERGGGARKKKD